MEARPHERRPQSALPAAACAAAPRVYLSAPRSQRGARSYAQLRPARLEESLTTRAPGRDWRSAPPGSREALARGAHELAASCTVLVTLS